MRKLTILAAIFAALVIGTPASAGVEILSPDATAISLAGSASGASSDAGASSDNSVKVESFDGSASAAAIVLGACQRGASAQTHMGGASAGTSDSVCLIFTASQMAAEAGNADLSASLLDRAVKILKWRTNPVRIFFQGLPIVGGYL